MPERGPVTCDESPPKAGMRDAAIRLRELCQVQPDACFVVDVRKQRAWTYREMLRVGESWADALLARGLAPGDRVASLLPNGAEPFQLLLAAANAGCSVVPLDPQIHTDELQAALSLTKAKLLCLAPGATPRSTSVEQIEVGELERGRGSLEGAPCSAAAAELICAWTSGSTGTPRGVALSNAAWTSGGVAIADFYGIGPGDVMACITPCHHMNALSLTGAPVLARGAAVCVFPVFDRQVARDFFDDVQRLGVNILSVTPAIMAVLMRIAPSGRDLARAGVRFVLCGAAPLSQTCWREFERAFKVPVYQGYGLTETATWVTMTPPGPEKRYDSVGVPVIGEVKIASESGPGEILLAGPTMMNGYLTGRSPFAGTYLRTGDLGYMKDGQLVISGRIKETIIRSGLNIHPAAIEDVLITHPEVRACAAVGLPHPLSGEAVAVVIVPEPEANLSEAAVREWLGARLSRSWLPDRIFFAESIPTTLTGKIKRCAVRARLRGDTTTEVLAKIGSRRFVRKRIAEDGEIWRAFQQRIAAGAPLAFVKYWGAGEKSVTSAADRRALERLAEWIEVLKRLYEPGGELTLIATPNHAALNGFDRQQVACYFDDVQRQAACFGFRFRSLAEHWGHDGVPEGVLEVRDDALEDLWGAPALREQLREQASRHAQGGAEPEAAARAYLALNLQERRWVVREFPDSIFLTYNRAEQADFLPELPRIFLSSLRPGHGVKPWFVL